VKGAATAAVDISNKSINISYLLLFAMKDNKISDYSIKKYRSYRILYPPS